MADDLIPLLTTNSLSVLADRRKAPNACEDVPVKEPIQIDDLAPMGRRRDHPDRDHPRDNVLRLQQHAALLDHTT